MHTNPHCGEKNILMETHMSIEYAGKSVKVLREFSSQTNKKIMEGLAEAQMKTAITLHLIDPSFSRIFGLFGSLLNLILSTYL